MDELVKRLHRYTENCVAYKLDADFASAVQEAADAIEELICEVADEHNARLDSEERQRWIPVTERLPEHDKNVLICYEWTGRSGTVYREVGIASIEELERDPTEMFRPLYWMPLPQPPKEET